MRITRPCERRSPLLPFRYSLICLLATSATVSPRAAELAPEEITELESAARELRESIANLRRSGKRDEHLADIEVHAKAIEWLVRFPEEAFDASFLDKARQTLLQGAARATSLAEGAASWTRATGHVIHAYRSRVDSSVQPYAMEIPAGHGESRAEGSSRAERLDVVLHGRDGKLSEVSFIARHADGRKASDGLAHLRLHVFGRTNNAYRWAGETDVLEALEAARSRYRIDPNKIVLRGFSMGGAGAWHLGLHFPDRWAAVEAGAGFTETQRYAKLPELPPHQLRTLRIYDAVDWHLNAREVPIVGYGGENDAQLQASTNVREALVAAGFPFERTGLDWLPRAPRSGEPLHALFLVGPGTGHAWHPESLARSEAFIDRALGAAGPEKSEDHVRFVTWTTRYARSRWVTVQGLERHYEHSEVDARLDRAAGRVEIRTRNINALTLEPPVELRTISIDGSTVELPQRRPPRPFVHLGKGRRGWGAEASHSPAPRERGLRKRPGLQGPIDDAFTDSFLCVRPTGDPGSSSVGAWAAAEFARLEGEFAKWMRGDPRVKDDVDVTADDMARHHLILFGDPASNAVLAKVLPGLPLRWTPLTVEIAGGVYPAVSHVPVLVYPNPFAPDRYIVLNSGHTFGEKEFRGTNAYLFPRLGDWAVLEIGASGTPESERLLGVLKAETVGAGIFDERWEPVGATGE